MQPDCRSQNGLALLCDEHEVVMARVDGATVEGVRPVAARLHHPKVRKRPSLSMASPEGEEVHPSAMGPLSTNQASTSGKLPRASQGSCNNELGRRARALASKGAFEIDVVERVANERWLGAVVVTIAKLAAIA